MNTEQEANLTRLNKPSFSQLNPTADIEKPKTKRGLKVFNKIVGQTNPEDKANCFSKMFFSWVSNIAYLGNKVIFKQHHHPQLSKNDRIENCFSSLNSIYKNNNITLKQAVYRAFKKDLCLTVVMDLFKALSDMGVIL